MLVVIVLFVLEEAWLARFRPAVVENAAASLKEPGCRRFDVAFSTDGKRCFLYEIYDDQKAFDAHLETPHFKAFNAVSGPWVKSKTVDTFQLVA